MDGLTALIRDLLRTPHTESDVWSLFGVIHVFPPSSKPAEDPAGDFVERLYAQGLVKLAGTLLVMAS